MGDAEAAAAPGGAARGDGGPAGENAEASAAAAVATAVYCQIERLNGPLISSKWSFFQHY